MRIYIGTTELTGEDMRERPGDLRINGRRLVQEATFLRALQARMYNRKNVKTTISFQVSREHDDIITCQEFMLSHYYGLPGSGNAKFVCESDSGSQATLWLANAVLGVMDFYHKGVSSFHVYQLAGGMITTEDPSS